MESVSMVSNDSTLLFVGGCILAALIAALSVLSCIAYIYLSVNDPSNGMRELRNDSVSSDEEGEQHSPVPKGDIVEDLNTTIAKHAEFVKAAQALRVGMGVNPV